jgi:hypothetical protein
VTHRSRAGPRSIHLLLLIPSCRFELLRYRAANSIMCQQRIDFSMG